MTESSDYLFVCFGTLFAVLSPFATVPPFLAMTDSDTRSDRLQMARRACTIACLVLVLFSLTGLTILDVFGITVPAFKIAGGILLLRTALEMLQGSRSRISNREREEGRQKEDISITPLAVPLLCGPVTIVSGILLSARAQSWLQHGILIATIVVIYLITYFVLRIAVTYSHLFGEIGRRIVTRLMGLLLAALAVQFAVNGITELPFVRKEAASNWTSGELRFAELRSESASQ